MHKNPARVPKNWLAFELNILRRLEFKSVSIPFTNNPNLGKYLKQWNIRVLANDLFKSSFIKTLANIENNEEKITEEEVRVILDDAYVPQYKLKNKALLNWFNETDSWWFDNIRQNIEKLPSEMHKAIALDLGIKVGDYVTSFDDETRQLRQPLSQVFKRFWNIEDDPINNNQHNKCHNRTALEFTAENYTDLLFLRLPKAHNDTLKKHFGKSAWRDEWVCGNDSFWKEMEKSQHESLGSSIETKSQYLNLITEFFKTAQHIDLWAIEHVEDGFIQTQDIVEAISEVRKVDTIYSKDFSELMGTRAVIITA